MPDSVLAREWREGKRGEASLTRWGGREEGKEGEVVDVWREREGAADECSFAPNCIFLLLVVALSKVRIWRSRM